MFANIFQERDPAVGTQEVDMDELLGKENLIVKPKPVAA